MFENLRKYQIYLVSGSPRRRELLQKLGIPFHVRTMEGIDESYPSTLQGEEIPAHLSRKKAEAYRSTMGADDLLIAADTIVYAAGKVLGKPADATEAREMLRLLSGRTHQVITGVTILTAKRTETFAVTSEVCFSHLSDEEIGYYVDRFLPLDKAGAYGIQEWIGLIAVEELRGSFFNVMGLPVQRLYRVLQSF